MNLKDFYVVATKVLQLLDEKDPTDIYRRLIDHLNNIRSNPTSELQTSINNTVQEITDHNQQVEHELNQIPHAQFIIERLNVTELVGDGATKKLDSILTTETYIAPSSVDSLIQDISSMKNQLRNIIDEFNKFGIDFEISEQLSILSVEYNGGESARLTTQELTTKLEEIEKIVHAFSRLSSDPKSFETPSIVSISKSSPLIIDLGDSAGIYMTLIFIGQAIKWAMNRIEQAYDIQIKHEELKRSGHTNPDITKGFRKLRDKLTSSSEVSRYTEQIYKEAKPDPGVSGAPNEVKKAVKEAIKIVINLAEQGVEVKVFLPPKKNEGEEEEGPDESTNITVDVIQAYKKLGDKQEKLLLLKEPANNESPDVDGEERDNAAK